METLEAPASAFARGVTAVRGALPAILLLVAAGASGWLLHDFNPTNLAPRTMSRHTPDLYVENFSSTTMDEQGRPLRLLEGDYMAHFPDTDTHEFAKPYLRLYREGGEPWHVVSERGWLSANGDVLLLLGKVRIWRNSFAGMRRIEIRTEDMRILPESNYGETDQPVSITTPHSQSRGVGMRAFLDTSRMELLSQVHTVYERNAFEN